MKTDDFDYGLKFKKKKSSNLSFILRIVVIIFAILIMFYLFFFITNISSDNSYEIDRNGERYGTSQFIKYQGEISVAIPSGGRYILENVDINSFRTLNSEDRNTGIIGLDKNSVYFGNIPIPNLNPNKLEIIGNGYYTDGTTTYFCSPLSERNKNLSVPMEVLQSLIYSFSKNKKAQTYIYPYKKVETNKNLRAIQNFSFFATDGEKVYYKGEELAAADLNTLKSVDEQNEYFIDKENVYYKSKLLPIKNSGKLTVVSSEQGDEFLYDEQNGYVFLEDYSFDRKKAPYKVLGNKGNHLYNLIFVADDGIYYYDNQKKKQLKAGDNIFVGNVEEISPNIFCDDKNIYYFHAYDVRSAGKSTRGVLISKNTEIYSLGKKENWEKIADIEEGRTGTIWKKGNKYYYFDNLGIFQLINHTIYEISNRNTLEYLLADDMNYQKIGEFIENAKLIVVNGEEKVKIKVKYEDEFTFIMKYFKIILIAIAVIGVLFRKYKNYKADRKLKDDNKM